MDYNKTAGPIIDYIKSLSLPQELKPVEFNGRTYQYDATRDMLICIDEKEGMNISIDDWGYDPEYYLIIFDEHLRTGSNKFAGLFSEIKKLRSLPEVSEVIEFNGRTYQYNFEYGILKCLDCPSWLPKGYDSLDVSFTDWLNSSFNKIKLLDYFISGAERNLAKDASSEFIPAKPETESSVGVCPVCENTGFDGTLCDICGYSEYPEGFGDIDTDSANKDNNNEQKEDKKESSMKRNASKFRNIKAERKAMASKKRKYAMRKTSMKKRGSVTDWAIFIGCVDYPVLGKWVSLPCDDSKIDAAIEYARQEHIEEGLGDIEEFMIPDYEGYFGISADRMEWQNPYKLNEACADAYDYFKYYPDEVIEGWLRYGDYDIFDADKISDIFYIEANNEYDLAYNYIEEVMLGVDQLDRNTLEQYFDYNGYGRTLAYDFYDCENGYYISK